MCLFIVFVAIDAMDKKEHLEYLRRKYIELNQQFLLELQTGKSIAMLKDVNAVMNTLLKEIDELEKSLKSEEIE
jgi:hypothetical protein